MATEIFRKKPVEVAAVRWTGDNEPELAAFTGGQFAALEELNDEDRDATAAVRDSLHSTWVLLRTGDWIIRGVRGEFYPCRDAVFVETYEPA